MLAILYRLILFRILNPSFIYGRMTIPVDNNFRDNQRRIHIRRTLYMN